MRAHVLCILCLAASLPALDDATLAQVVRIADGESLVVGTAGDGEGAVRLLWISAPDAGHPFAPQAKELLERLCPPGTAVVLRSQAYAGSIARDAGGRWLAVLQLPGGGTVQEGLIKAGASAYWRKPGDAPAADGLHDRLLRAQESAEVYGAGLWTADRPWITARQGERREPTPGEADPFLDERASIVESLRLEKERDDRLRAEITASRLERERLARERAAKRAEERQSADPAPAAGR